MRLNWQPHYLSPKDLSHAHHNGYSIIWARTSAGRFMIGDALYELAPYGDGIIRFNNRKDLFQALARLAKKGE